MAMLDFQLVHRGIVRDAGATAKRLRANPATRAELIQLTEVLGDQIGLADERDPRGELAPRAALALQPARGPSLAQ